MLRNLSIALITSALMVGCGGSSGGGNKTQSPSSSSLPASSVGVSSSSLASSSVVKSSLSSSVTSSSLPGSSLSSSSAASASAGVVVLVADKWVANDAQVSQTNQGPNVSVSKEYAGAKYTLAAPVPVFEGATVDVVVEVSSELKASGAGLQLFAYVDASPWPSKNDCPIIASADLVVGSQTIRCVLDSGGKFNQTANPFGVGIQAVAGLVNGSKLPITGTFLITSGQIVLPSAAVGSSSSVATTSSVASTSSSVASSSLPSSSVGASSSSAPAISFALPAASWYAKDSVVSQVVDGGVNFTFTAGYQAAGFWLNASDAAIEGMTVEVEFMVDANYKTSGAGLKLYADVQAEPYPSKADCPVLDNAALTPGVAQTIQCVMNSGGAFTQTAAGVELKLWAEPGATGTPNGVVQIKGGSIFPTI